MATDALDIRLRVDFLQHWKTKKLSVRLGPEGILCLLRLYLFARQAKPSGELMGMSSEDISIAADWLGDDRFVPALVECSFLDRLENGGFSIHDWEEHQTWASQAEKRTTAARTAAVSRWDKKRQRMVGKVEPQCGVDTTAMRRQCAGNATAMPETRRDETNETNETNETKKEETPIGVLSTPERVDGALTPIVSVDDCPYKVLRALHQEICPQFPQPSKVEGPFRENFRARWRENPDVEIWKDQFRRASMAPWLNGSGGWHCPGLRWIVNKTNWQKIADGEYEPKTGGPLFGKFTEHNLAVRERMLREGPDGRGIDGSQE